MTLKNWPKVTYLLSADEKYFGIVAAMSRNRRVYIIDARPKENAYANRVVGGGYEDSKNYSSSKKVSR